MEEHIGGTGIEADHRRGEKSPGGRRTGTETGGRVIQCINLAGKAGRLDAADSNREKAPLCLSRAPHHAVGMSGDHPGLRHPIPHPPAGAAGRPPEPAPAGLGPGPATLWQPAGGVGVEEQLPVQGADVIARVTAPLLAGIPLPPKTILANPPNLLVDADPSYIPEIDHQPISSPSSLSMK